jgi:hypothetical protein
MSASITIRSEVDLGFDHPQTEQTTQLPLPRAFC